MTRAAPLLSIANAFKESFQTTGIAGACSDCNQRLTNPNVCVYRDRLNHLASMRLDHVIMRFRCRYENNGGSSGGDGSIGDEGGCLIRIGFIAVAIGLKANSCSFSLD